MRGLRTNRSIEWHCESRGSFPDGSLLPSGSLVELELQNMRFNLGSLWLVVMCCMGLPYHDILEQVDRLFNYITVAFYWRGNETERGE